MMTETKKRRSQAERVEATRGVLMATARQLFGAKGYDHTSTVEILALAGLTRGALYHHFDDKRALFLAVADELDRGINRAVAHVLAELQDPQERLLKAVSCYLDLAAEPAAAQILLIDAPAVLGLTAWLESAERQAVPALADLLDQCRPPQQRDPDRARIQAQLAAAAIDRAALGIAKASPDQSLSERYRQEVATYIQAITVVPSR